MSTTFRATKLLKQTQVIIAAIVAVVIIVIWLLAFFLPQGSKLSSLNSKQQTLQQEVAAGNAKVARLKRTFENSNQLETQYQKVQAYVPSTPDIFKTTADYASALSATVAASQMTLTAVTPSSAASSGHNALTSIPVTLAVKGTYDHLLALIKSIYTMSRLTDINSVDVTGGGPNTTRGTVLDVSLALVIFTTVKASTP